MSYHGSMGSAQSAAAAAAAAEQQPLEPRRLELTLNPTDGSLRTAPLSTVVLAATDDIYSDLYNMAAGELDVVMGDSSQLGADAAANNELQGGGGGEDNPAAAAASAVADATTKKERMSNLSFAQRRHELAWRLARHGKTVMHTTALTAAAADGRMSTTVAVSSTALQHSRAAWNQADEAQDALYFFHAQLFPSRQAPHDVYGAADLQLAGQWYDLCRDLQLAVDPYESSREASHYTSQELQDLWQMAVRRKLVTGEVGWMRRKQQQRQHAKPTPAVLWKVSLQGGLIRLTHGRASSSSSQQPSSSSSSSSAAAPAATSTNGGDANSTNNNSTEYPIEALLTVFPSKQTSNMEWTLLALNVRVQPKTGEFNHQLETSNRQRYDLHRLAALAMSREEARARIVAAAAADKDKKDDADAVAEATEAMDENGDMKMPAAVPDDSADDDLLSADPPARPLHALFQVAHRFALSWQLEVLSAQAQGLRRGVWAAVGGSTGAGTIQVDPVRFFDHPTSSSTGTTSSSAAAATDDDDDEDDMLLGAVSISFWRVDDSNGPPTVSDLYLTNDSSATAAASESSGFAENGHHHAQHTAGRSRSRRRDWLSSSRGSGSSSNSQLQLVIRAHADTGIQVALSGAAGILDTMQTNPRVRSTVQDLLEAASNPLALSASDALLAATKLCAERKCYAVVQALQQQQAGSSSSILPHWMALVVEHGSIAICTRVQYYPETPTTVEQQQQERNTENNMPILFRLMCDARTGSFVPTFPRMLQKLRQLAGTSDTIGDTRPASEPIALRMASLPPNRRRIASANSSSRCVRDAFAGLVRSMNLLGQRVAVGGTWDDLDAQQSAQLRHRAVQTACADVRTSLTKCCAMAALYGLVPLAVSSAVGLDAIPDMTGGVMESVEQIKLLPVPPISIRLHQELVEKATATSNDGVTRKTSFIQETLLSMSCFVGDNGPVIVPMEVTVKLDSPAALPRMQHCELLQFDAITRPDMNGNGLMSDDSSSLRTDNLIIEAGHFAELLSDLVDFEDEDGTDG